MPRDTHLRRRGAASGLCLDRAFAARRARERDRRASAERRRALCGEAQRPQRVRLVRRGARSRAFRAAQARREYPHRDQEGRFRPLLPAADRPLEPADRRFRGACPLALAGRNGAGRGILHRGCRAHRPHRPTDVDDHGTGDEAVARLAGAPQARGQRLARAIPRPDARRADFEAAVVDRFPGEPAGDRDHGSLAARRSRAGVDDHGEPQECRRAHFARRLRDGLCQPGAGQQPAARPHQDRQELHHDDGEEPAHRRDREHHRRARPHARRSDQRRGRRVRANPDGAGEVRLLRGAGLAVRPCHLGGCGAHVPPHERCRRELPKRAMRRRRRSFAAKADPQPSTVRILETICFRFGRWPCASRLARNRRPIRATRTTV